MKRTNEEFKAEVFRRRDEYYKKRRKRISTITAACVPFAVCVAFFTVMILPAMMPAGSTDMSDPGNKTNGYDPYYSTISGDGATAEVSTTTIVMTDAEFLKTASEIYFTADGITVTFLGKDAKDEMISFMKELVSNEEEGIQEISKPTSLGKALYEIKIYSDTGEVRTYSVYKDFIVSREKIYHIEESDFEKIKDILGIDG